MDANIEPLLDRAQELVSYCTEAVTDYDGSQMAEGEQPRIPPSCRDLRSFAAVLSELSAALREQGAL